MEEREFNYLILSGKQKKNKQTKTTEGRIWFAPLHRANEIIHVLCDKWPQKKTSSISCLLFFTVVAKRDWQYV